MPRKSKELTLTPQEKEELLKFVSGTDSELSLRARIILACSEENQNKKVASNLGTSETNVRNWKEAFRREGIRSLENSHAIGRPVSKDKPDNLPALVSSFIEQHPEDWTAESLAQELSVSVNDVYHALRKIGIPPSQRQRSWTYKTEEAASEGRYHISGIYLTCDVKILIIAEMDRSLSGHRLSGEISTKNAKLYSLMQKSAEPLSAADCVVAFSGQSSYVRRGRRQTPLEFLTESANISSKLPVIRQYVFICSKESVPRPAGCSDVVFFESDSEATWFGQVGVWHSATCRDDPHIMKAAENIMLQTSTPFTEKTEPVIWKLAGITEVSEQTSENKTPEYVTDLKELDARVSELAEQKKGYLGTELLISAGDGKLIRKLIESDTALPAADECDFSSMESFEKCISRLDDAMTEFSRKIGTEGRRTYLQEIKKNGGR